MAAESARGSAGRMRSAASISMIWMSRVGVDAVEAVGDDVARVSVQFGGEFGARRAGADDGDVQLPGRTGPPARWRAGRR